MEGLGVPLCCRHPEISSLQEALHFYCTLGPVNYVARAIPRPSQKLQQQDSCSYAPAGVGRYTCYSRVTKAGFCPGRDQHSTPFPFLLSVGLPQHSVSSCHSFLVQSFFKATAWQRDRGGSSSVSYPIPFFPPRSLFPFLPWPPLFLIWTPGWGLGLEHRFHSSETFPTPSKPPLSVDTLAPASCAIC